MVCVIAIIKRKPGMTVEAFQEYWRTTHAGVVRPLPGLRRYVQSHTLASGYRKGEPAWDGIAELWFDSVEALRALRGTPEQTAVDADEPRFIDRASMTMLLTDQHVIKAGPAPAGAAKWVEFLNRRPGLSPEAFQRHWREVHGPIAAGIPQIRRYVQSHVRLGAYASRRTPRYDGVAITWFDDTAAMRASATTVEYAATRADEANFLAPGDAPFIITREHVVVGP
jgi:uncharacterized protein (TIGR02118 family)